MTLRLPKYEMYELGSQLRRSADSITTNIVEGYARKKYKADFLKFPVYAHASSDEKLYVLYPGIMTGNEKFKQDYENLGRKILSFIRYVESSWKT